MSQAEDDRTDAEALLNELLPVGEAETAPPDGPEAAPDQPAAAETFGVGEPDLEHLAVEEEQPLEHRTVQAMGARANPMVEVVSGHSVEPAQPHLPVPVPAEAPSATANHVSVPARAQAAPVGSAVVPVRSGLPSIYDHQPEAELDTRSILPLALAAMFIIVGFAAVGFWLGTRNASQVSTEEVADQPVESAEPASPDIEDQSAVDAEESVDGTGDGVEGSAETTDGSGGAAAESDGAADNSDGAVENAEGSDVAVEGTDGAAEAGQGEFPAELTSLTRSEIEELNLPHAVLEDGIVHVRGRVPNEAIVALTETRVEPILGEGNFEVEFEVDPSVPLYVAAPMYVDDVVLYDFNGSDISAEFDMLLARGTQLLELFPTTTVTIVAFTDSVGTEESNLLVSRERAQAVADYWIGRGIDPSRITIDARGEEGASDDDDPETAASRRRVEFIFDGLLN